MSHAIPLRRGVYRFRRGRILVLMAVDSSGRWLEEREVRDVSKYGEAVSALYRALRAHEFPHLHLLKGRLPGRP